MIACLNSMDFHNINICPRTFVSENGPVAEATSLETTQAQILILHRLPDGCQHR